MKIIVQSDDGKQQASVEWSISGEYTPRDVLESLVRAQCYQQAEDIVESITVTSSLPVAEPESDGFKFKVGQRVRTISDYSEQLNRPAREGNITVRQEALGHRCYRVDGIEGFIDELWLEPAE